MTPRDELMLIVRTWDDYFLWRLEWERDVDTWMFLPLPPWSAEA